MKNGDRSKKVRISNERWHIYRLHQRMNLKHDILLFELRKINDWNAFSIKMGDDFHKQFDDDNKNFSL